MKSKLDKIKYYMWTKEGAMVYHLVQVKYDGEFFYTKFIKCSNRKKCTLMNPCPPPDKMWSKCVKKEIEELLLGEHNYEKFITFDKRLSKETLKLLYGF